MLYARDRSVANLRFIAEHDQGLAELERQTGVIEANLRAINDDENDLEKLEARTGKIAGHMRAMEEES